MEAKKFTKISIPINYQKYNESLGVALRPNIWIRHVHAVVINLFDIPFPYQTVILQQIVTIFFKKYLLSHVKAYPFTIS